MRAREREGGVRESERVFRKRSTYNRKQRNLACSDSDFLGLIREGQTAAEVEKGNGGTRGVVCATHRRNKDGGRRRDAVTKE